ncbi:MAG: hypothetical protein ABIH48_00585 [Candidatus Falkowbacteria bacterium]
MNQTTEVIVEVRNPDGDGVGTGDYIMEVEVAFNESGCRIPVKNQRNGSVFITGAVESNDIAEEIKDRFFCSDGSVKPEFDGDIIAISW